MEAREPTQVERYPKDAVLNIGSLGVLARHLKLIKRA